MDERLLIYLLFGILMTIVVIFLAVVLLLIRNNQKSEQMAKMLKSELDEKQNQLLNANLLLSASLGDIKSAVNKDFLSFVQSLNANLDSISDATYSQMVAMERRIADNIQKNSDASKDLYTSLNEKIANIISTQKGLDELSKEIFDLQSILKDKKARGVFGEMELYNLLEASFGNNSHFYRKQYQLPNGNIADAAIFTASDAPIICIDSKFPLENYRRMLDENLDIQSRNIARKQFGKDVQKHLVDIKNRYIISGVTADLAYMFIPAEAVFAEINANYQQIVEESYRLHVYLVSPTTLMAYLNAIRSLYLGIKRDQAAKDIQHLLGELSKEFTRFMERTGSLEKDYQRLQTDFEAISISAKKIVKYFERIKNVDTDDQS